MATIYKKSRDKGKKRSRYYFDYTDHNGKRRTERGFTDKGETERLAAKREHCAMLRRTGMIDPSDEKRAAQRLLPIDDQLSTYEQSLSAGTNTEKHVRLAMSRVRKIIDGCEVETIADLDSETIEAFLTKFRQSEGIGHRTNNHYVQAIDAFGRWLVSSKRTNANPVAGLKRLNSEVDVRRKRRALTPDEFAKLIQSARSSTKSIQCFDGETRSRIYMLSYLTGLRRGELASLTPQSFNLDGNPATLTVEAACSKHRRTDVLPLHPELVSMLREWLAELSPNEPMFPKLKNRRTWLMVKRDLEGAGIEYETADGVADFHAAGRHSYITELMRNGATLPEAKELARHSDVKMTMRYTHIGIEDQAEAIRRLPCQWIVSDSDVTNGHSMTADVNDSEAANSDAAARPCEQSRSVNENPSVTQGATEGSWRRRELNPRPEMELKWHLRAYFVD